MLEGVCCFMIVVAVGIPIAWWFISKVMNDIGKGV